MYNEYEMRDYTNLVDALKDLKARGYSNDFNLHPDCIECAGLDLKLHPEHFVVKEVYRFEGDSTPDDNSVLFAIESDEGLKGTLVDAYGTYSEALNQDMATKLRSVQPHS